MAQVEAGGAHATPGASGGAEGDRADGSSRGGRRPRDAELVAAAEADQVACDDVLHALELVGRGGDRLEHEDAVPGAQLAAAERERDRARALVALDVELVAEVLAELDQVRR